MGLITGVRAAINGLACLREFRIRVTADDTVAAASNTAGAVTRIAGNCDFSGIARGYGHTPLILPGAKFQFKGTDRAGMGWKSDNAAGLGCICDRVQIFAPSDAGQRIYYDLHFSADGSLGQTTTPWALDTHDQEYFSARGLGVALNALSAAPTWVSGVTYWDLDLFGGTTPPAYGSDSVVDANGDVWPHRDGGNFDATVIWRQRFNAVADLPTVNAFYPLRLQTTRAVGAVTATFWTVKTAQIEAVTPVYVMEGGDAGGGQTGQGRYVRAEEIMARWTSWQGAAGTILAPSGTAWWP